MTLRKISSIITNNIQNGAARAMLYGVGLTQNDLNKYLVGVGSMQFDGNPCNKHLGKLQNSIRNSIYNNKMVGLNFNTVGVSDGITNGNSGMHYSLPSRELITDSIETMINAHHYDGFILLPGCDKNLPASMMAMGRINRPSILVYGGTMLPGNYKKKEVDIVNAFQSYGELLDNKITKQERENLLKSCCHKGGGSCSGMYTCNTMAVISEVMGLSPPHSSSNPANSRAKREECFDIGYLLLNLLDRDIKPRDIITKESFFNAMKLTVILGGSTNAILHLLAIAKDFDINLTLDDFDEILQNTPVLGNLKPIGEYSMNDIYNIHGLPTILKYLLKNDILDGKTNTITGYTLQENINKLNLPNLDFSKKVIFPLNKPLKENSHIQIMKGNLAPKGAIAKISEKKSFVGKAKVFKTEDDMINALEKKLIEKGDVVVITHQGPKSGPGMPELLKPSSALIGAGLGKDVALITDGRWSGGSHGILIGHITPETYDDGLIGYIEEGDCINIDLINNKLTLEVCDKILHERRKNSISKMPIKGGYLNKYTKLVTDASEGCTTN